MFLKKIIIEKSELNKICNPIDKLSEIKNYFLTMMWMTLK